MAERRVAFTPIPIPTPGSVPQELLASIVALRHDVMLLTGQLGDASARAVLKGELKVDPVPELFTTTTPSVDPRPLSLDGQSVASGEGLRQVMETLASLHADVVQLRQAMTNLVNSLRR